MACSATDLLPSHEFTKLELRLFQRESPANAKVFHLTELLPAPITGSPQDRFVPFKPRRFHRIAFIQPNRVIHLLCYFVAARAGKTLILHHPPIQQFRGDGPTLVRQCLQRSCRNRSESPTARTCASCGTRPPSPRSGVRAGRKRGGGAVLRGVRLGHLESRAAPTLRGQLAPTRQAGRPVGKVPRRGL